MQKSYNYSREAAGQACSWASGRTDFIADRSRSYCSWLFLIGIFFLGFSDCIDSSIFERFWGVSLPGRLTLQELLFVVCAPLVLYKTKLDKITKILLVAIGLWFFFQVLTDFYRDIPWEDRMRGGARIAVFGFALICFKSFLRLDRRVLALFLFGASLSYVFRYVFFPKVWALEDPWKWYISHAVTYGVVGFLVIINLRKSFFWALAFGLIGCVSLYQNSRSHAGVLLLVALYISFYWVLRKLPVYFRLLSMLAAGSAVLITYAALSGGGVLGEAAREKFNAQFREDKGAFSVLLMGRREYRASFMAIADSPIIGYGSWAKHPEYVYYLYDPADEEFSLSQYADMVELGVIPSHSYLFGAWVDSGIFGGAMWLVIWICCGTIFLSLRIDADHWMPKVALYFSGFLLWEIMYSPFGTEARVITAFAMTVIIMALPWAGSVNYKKSLLRK